MTTNKQILDLLGPDAEALLNYKATGFPKEKLHLPGPDFVVKRSRCSIVGVEISRKPNRCAVFRRMPSTAPRRAISSGP